MVLEVLWPTTEMEVLPTPTLARAVEVRLAIAVVLSYRMVQSQPRIPQPDSVDWV